MAGLARSTVDFIGLDGCPAGWFYVGLSEAGQPAFGIARSAGEVAALGEGARLALIDIPIGLHEDGAAERQCDKEARRLLGRPRASSVFPAPVRQALEATSYEDACRCNFAITGKRISRQGFHICRKIREIDRLLRDRADLRPVFREMHPEVAFWGLNGAQPTMHSKRRAAGRRERLQILSKHLPNAQAIFLEAANTFRRRDVGRDDILDAMVGAVTGWIGHGRLSTVPARPERDRSGLPMEMAFWRPPRLAATSRSDP